MPHNPLVDSGENIDSDKDVHFVGALAQNAGEEANISFPANWVTLNVQKVKVLNISVLSDQPLDWELQFYAKDTQADTDADVDSFITSMFFDTTDSKQIGGSGLYSYDANPAHLPFVYDDQDRTSELHLTLVNRNATAKTAGATGEVKVRIYVEPIV